MKRLLSYAFAAAWFATIILRADDQSSLLGKWSLQKTNEEGQKITQILDVKKDKFTFEILDAENRVSLYAEGDLKLEKFAPFNIARFTHIRGGDSAANLEDVDDDHVIIYTLDGDVWTIAENFDKERDQKPGVDLYRRVKETGATSTLIIDEIQMNDTPQSATWFACFEAKVGETSKRFYVEDKGYDKNLITIPMALEIPQIKAGQTCSFKLQLDDVDGDACGDDMDNRSTGEFTINAKGSQDYKPEANWKYTVRWHLK